MDAPLQTPTPPSDAEFASAPTVEAPKPPTDAEFDAAPQAHTVPQAKDSILNVPEDVLQSFAKDNPEQTERDIKDSWLRQDEGWKNPDNQLKAARVWRSLKANAPGPVEQVKKMASHPLDTLGSAFGAAIDVGKGLFKQAKTYAEAGVRAAVRPLAAELGADTLTPEKKDELQRQIAENWAGTESAATHLAGDVSNLGHKVMRFTGQELPVSEQSDESAHAGMMQDLAMEEQQQKIARGHGEFLGSPLVGGHVVKELEEKGKPLRPEEVAARAAGDPLSFELYNKAFGAAGKAVDAATPAIVKQAGTALVGDLGDIAKGAVAKPIKALGKAAETAGKVSGGAGELAPVAGGLIGLGKAIISGDVSAVLPSATAGYFAGKSLRYGERILKSGGKKLSELGENIESKGPAQGAKTQLTRDVLESLPAAAASTAKGAAFDIGFNQATQELPEEKARPLQIGTALGMAHGLLGMGKHTLSGQIIAPREFGDIPAVPSKARYPGISEAHDEAFRAASPASKNFVNAARTMLADRGSDANVFLIGPETADGLKSIGMSDQSIQQIMQNRAVKLDGPDGRGIILLNDPGSAPHEAMHALDTALGPEMVDKLNQKVFSDYSPEEFAAVKEHQAAQLGGSGDTNTKILTQTGWGDRAAKMKLKAQMALADYMTRGTQIPDAELTKAVNAIWEENRRTDPNAWKKFLTPEEQNGAADAYVAAELRAENFDAYFKHAGPTLEAPGGIIPRAARAIGKTVEIFGKNPIEDRSSEGQGYPLKPGVIESNVEAVKGLKPTAKPVIPAAAPTGAATGTPPTSNQEAEKVRALAEKASAEPMIEGGQPEREILAKVAESIANDTGLALQHSGAPDEPAASITSDRTQRRAIIEAYRNLPQTVRQMWPKVFFPAKVKKSGQGLQVQGWAPEVFSSNAHKLAEFFAKTAPEKSPYEIDTNTGSLSERGWQDFFNDVTKIAIPNYKAGRTASGVELQFPQDLLQRRGFFKPEIKGRAGKLDQAKADFINMAMGFKSPETARINRGKLPQNIAAQEISAATMPGRVEPTIEPRGAFKGPEAEALGIEGAPIQEVNPLVNEVKRTAAEHNVPAPSLIEAWQNLNLRNIKSAEHAPEQPEFRPNTAAVISGFQSGRPGSREVTVVSPEGDRYRARFDGYQEFGPGKMLTQFTMIDNTPIVVKNSTTYDKTLEKHGYKVEGEIPSPEQWEKEREATAGAMQFQPGGKPEAIKEAAVQRPDGEIFTGPTHSHAYFKAAEQPGHEDTQFLHYKEGFVTNKGEFLNREQAYDRALEQKQLPEGADANFSSPASSQMESLAFREQRQFQGGKFSAPEFSQELDKVRESGGGQTFNSDGSVAKPQGDVVTLASRNIPQSDLNAENVRKALRPYMKALELPDVKAGVFAFEKDGKPVVSVDVNVVVPQEHRENTKKFAADNDQVSFWDGVKGEEVKTGGTGGVGLESPEAVIAAAEKLVAGEPVTPEVSSTSLGGSVEDYESAQDYMERGGEQYMAGKKKDPNKLPAPRGAEPSKAWILPTGKLEAFGATWHHDWLDKNKDVQKQYGLKIPAFKGYDREGVRESALAKGFGRVNLTSDGSLHVELRAKDWKKLRPTVEDMVESNLDNIDRLHVSLMNDSGEMQTKLMSGDIFHADSDREKSAAAMDILDGGDGGLRQGGGITMGDWEAQHQAGKGKQEDLFGAKQALSSRELGDMSQKQVKEHFPEAIVPRDPKESIDSDIVNSPLAKANKKDPHQAFADKLVEFANSVKDTPEFQDGKQWYSEFTPMLKKEFGKDAPLMAQLLAATSPRVNPTVNFAFALDALEGFKSGRFKSIIPKFNEGMEKLNDGSWKDTGAKTPAEFMDNWIEEHDLKPTQSNGKLYGMRSVAVLQVLAGQWLENNKGPKVSQFVKNLMGTNQDATIDVWADRTMRRLGYEGFKDRWRILPANQAGVSDADFSFSQEAFRRAAKKLDMTPADLQGALWFAEKRLWADRGWGKLDLGDFRKEMEKVDLLRSGIKQRETAQKAGTGQKVAKQVGLDL